MTSRWGSQALAEGLRLGCRGAFSAAESVDTSMAGFGALRPTRLPDAPRFRSPEICADVSRRICAALSMRRNDHPVAQRDDLLFLFFAQDIAH